MFTTFAVATTLFALVFAQQKCGNTVCDQTQLCLGTANQGQYCQDATRVFCNSNEYQVLCPPNARCERSSASNSAVCVAEQSTDNCGNEPCKQGTVCVTMNSNEKRCLVPCDATGHCPENTACQQLTSGSFCMEVTPMLSGCSPDKPCSDGFVCNTQRVCVREQNTGDGCNSNDQCAADQFCSFSASQVGQCVRRECDERNPCTNNGECENFKCVANTNSCPDGCEAGFACVNSVCMCGQQTDCGNGRCDADLGKCVDTEPQDLCANKQCNGGECDPKTGECVSDDRCANVRCSDVEKCVNGFCHMRSTCQTDADCDKQGAVCTKQYGNFQEVFYTCIVPNQDVQCSATKPCAEDHYCSSDNVCVKKQDGICRDDTDCANTQTPVCNNGKCVARDDTCSPNSLTGSCPMGSKCENGQCVEIGNNGCTSDSQCPADAPNCHTGQCVSVDNKCSPNTPNGVCPTGSQCREGQCVQVSTDKCEKDSQCAADAPHCRDGQCVSADNRCSENSLNGACPTGTKCQNGQCVKIDGCQADSECPADAPFCKDGQCVSSDNNDNKCSPNVPDGDCPMGTKCKEGQCVQIEANGCENDSECPAEAPSCFNGRCVNKCSATSPNGGCDDDFVCVEGECKPMKSGCTSSQDCPNGYCARSATNEAGVCRQLSADQCTQDRPCNSGECVYESNNEVGRCKPKDDGMLRSCSKDTECDDDKLYCAFDTNTNANTGVCKPKPVDSGMCTSDSDCQGVCDTEKGVCKPADTNVECKIDQASNRFVGCQDDQKCVEGKCVDAQTQTCQATADGAGSGCEQDFVCVNGACVKDPCLRCKEQNLSCFKRECVKACDPDTEDCEKPQCDPANEDCEKPQCDAANEDCEKPQCDAANEDCEKPQCDPNTQDCEKPKCDPANEDCDVVKPCEGDDCEKKCEGDDCEKKCEGSDCEKPVETSCKTDEECETGSRCKDGECVIRTRRVELTARAELAKNVTPQDAAAELLKKLSNDPELSEVVVEARKVTEEDVEKVEFVIQYERKTSDDEDEEKEDDPNAGLPRAEDITDIQTALDTSESITGGVQVLDAQVRDAPDSNAVVRTVATIVVAMAALAAL